ncbi:hypothetical protein CL622_00125 [archaeon]|nr:hypothetical protein [archaeon]|tara:strand:+ start:2187 stop:2582 length:396 start_codon:yes stop_codon:yes gene_type:complete
MKSAIVIDTEYTASELMNAVSCITTGMFDGGDKWIGSEVPCQDSSISPITKVPIIIFKKNNKDWKELIKRAKRNKLKYSIFTQEAQLSKTYEEYMDKVSDMPFDSLHIMGIGVIGNKEKVSKFCGDLPLYR